MAKKRTTSPRKGSSKKRAPSRKTAKSRGFSPGKFTLGLLILVALGYGYLAIQEGKLVPDAITDIQDQFTSSDEESGTLSEPENPSNDSQSPKELKSFDFDDFDLYFTKAFDFMWPAYEADQAIIERPYYTIRYNEAHEQAMWVAYRLHADSLSQEKHERKDDFRKDPRVRTGSAELSDYKGSGYDRGHLAPAGDFSYDEFALSQSFYMSNMSPQAPSFNRGIWRKLEAQVRDWASENKSLYVVTGPVLDKTFQTIGKNQVSVPDYYYKIVLDIDKPDVKAIAFLMKNEKSSEPLESFTTTIDRIEALTGIDFFPSMPDELEDALEGNKMNHLWF